MKELLFILLALSSSSFALPTLNFLPENNKIEQLFPFLSHYSFTEKNLIPLKEIETLLKTKATGLNPAVITKVMTTLKCARQYNTSHNDILTIIDYSLPSNQKRLWVFHLKEKQLLFYTYVSHGIKSGTLQSNYFSNKYNSKASSIGVYRTDKDYVGREGLSLQLEGLDRGINDNATNRAIVMHSGWYVDEQFIKKYGRAGRSWGCPSLPPTLSASIIKTIRDHSLFIVYYPSDTWFTKSKFLSCEKPKQSPTFTHLEASILPNQDEAREEVLFAYLHRNAKHEENEAIVALSAHNYERIFQIKAPLERMLRRRINHEEYIALSSKELQKLITASEHLLKSEINDFLKPTLLQMSDAEPLNENSHKNDYFKDLHFVVAVLKMNHGYYQTEMKIVDPGKIKDIKLNANPSTSYTLYFENKAAINLKPTNRFIRWVGL